ncbi:MAG TPA: SMP-30/gluconolactonase/LRE family protein [Gammaproteobacteria bacterium]|nr:SMP-30/gluconolactonase/LRE family protein [Gammaproteobacteria bacterium]
MVQISEVASGLLFPEGPIAMPDGSVIVVEIARGTLTRIQPDGSKEIVAETGGGPNGAAVGPDGKIYVCNNGGFAWHERNGELWPGGQPDDYSGGRIEKIDPDTGEVEVLYREVDGNRLRGPNDLVFDRSGGFWFTDRGKTRRRDRDRGGVYYARADGSLIKEVVFGTEGSNGIGLSADENHLFVAETITGRLWKYQIVGEGEIRKDNRARIPGELVIGLPGMKLLDSLAIDSRGYVCVATLVDEPGINSIAPDGSTIEFMGFDDPLPTNICFGGKDLKTAYVTLSASGRLVRCTWPVAGLPLNFLNNR